VPGWRTVIILFLISIIQHSFLALLAPKWPLELPLLVTLLYALRWGEGKGAKLGAFFGLLEDLYLGRYVGLHVVGYVAAGLAAGWAGRRFFRENLVIFMGLIFALTFFHQIVSYLLLYVFGFPADLLAVLSQIAWPRALVHALLAPFLYQPVVAIPLEKKARLQYLG